jgi:hypothetical protein
MTARLIHPVTPWVALVVFAFGLLVVAQWDRWLADSVCWSAIGFLFGYFVCRLEVQLRALIKEHRDYT